VAKIPTFVVAIRWVAGALNDVAPDATAFAHRDVEVMLTGVSLGPPPVQAAAAADVDAFWSAVAPHTAGAYSGFISEVDETSTRLVYPPETYERLASIKGEVDPTNLFRRNVNVPPAA
jgi:FAD/FMN-containing dehydrogenase